MDRSVYEAAAKAQMQYGHNQAGRATNRDGSEHLQSAVLGNATKRPVSTLEGITERIMTIAAMLDATRSGLTYHADRAFGEGLEAEGRYVSSEASPFGGQVGSIFAALDTLEGAAKRVQEAADRNCKLA